MNSFVSHLECFQCGDWFNPSRIHTYCQNCNQPLLVKYNLNEIKSALTPRAFTNRVHSLWRYGELLPLQNEENKVTLEEGFTPLYHLKRLGNRYELPSVWVKEEGLNPTGSFKARGQTLAISKAKELGVQECIVPSAGNAGGAMSAYCAAAGIKATVVMPSYTPGIFVQECKLFGAHVELIDGLIDACGARVAEIKAETGAYDVSTLKEPYRLEGKKTMGFEIAEQFNWQLPDYIFYPTGGGTGLIGIWKAFAELMELGWIEGPLPKMVVVQAENCNPVVRTFNREPVPESFQGSMANGLAVPKAFGMDMMLKVLEESAGIAISISEEDMLEGIKEISSTEGITISPEGAAVWKAMMQLVSLGEMNRDSKVLLMNTGSGYKYFENYPAE